MARVTVASLTVYPVKSGRGVAVGEADVVDRGLAGDRRWMVVDGERVFISQRTHPRLALIRAAIADGRLALDAPDRTRLVVETPPADAPTVPVQVWDDICAAQPAPPEAARWLSALLGLECQLVFLPDRTHRAVAPRPGVPSAEVSFADGYPFLLLSEASLEDLNRRLERPVPMDRFRPNLVVRGCAPYDEDGWRRVKIGAVTFHVVRPCSRCSTTTVDQATGERGREPLATLATYRRAGDKVMFGQNLVHEGVGRVRVGDDVELLDPA